MMQISSCGLQHKLGSIFKVSSSPNFGLANKASLMKWSEGEIWHFFSPPFNTSINIKFILQSSAGTLGSGSLPFSVSFFK